MHNLTVMSQEGEVNKEPRDVVEGDSDLWLEDPLPQVYSEPPLYIDQLTRPVYYV